MRTPSKACNLLARLASASQRANTAMAGAPNTRKMSSASDRRTPFMIGVAGGTASGKSTVCERIRQLVVNEDAENGRQIITLSQDSFYRDLTAKESDQATKGMFNFDHPDAFDHQLMVKCLKDIKECRSTQ